MTELDRFQQIAQRHLPCTDGLDEWLAGKRVLVTGGTGCIGSELVRRILRSSAVVGSVSRHLPTAAIPGVSYYECDIRNLERLEDVFTLGWDVVFHTAAQRDPGRAEVEVRRTITTNAVGTFNVLTSARDNDIPQVVYASTGKALRPWSPEVYTASKRIAEWFLANFGNDIPLISGTRFTHVAANSIILERLYNWSRCSAPVKLHAKGIQFYVQSAVESAELLLAAGAYATEGVPSLFSITDLEEPVDLTQLAKGVIAEVQSDSVIDYTGYGQGYETHSFPGLYDPRTAPDVSPLINGMEAAHATQPLAGVDAFPIKFQCDEDKRAYAAFLALDIACDQDMDLRHPLNEMSWVIASKAVAAADPAVCRRMSRLCDQSTHLTGDHKILATMLATRAKLPAMA